MLERHRIAADGDSPETEIAKTRDGTFTRYFLGGRWSPWMSEATMESKEPTYLASR